MPFPHSIAGQTPMRAHLCILAGQGWRYKLFESALEHAGRRYGSTHGGRAAAAGHGSARIRRPPRAERGQAGHILTVNREPNRTEPKPNRKVGFSVFRFGFGFYFSDLRSSASASVSMSNQTKHRMQPKSVRAPLARPLQIPA